MNSTHMTFKYTLEYMALQKEYESSMENNADAMNTLRILTCMNEDNPSDYTLWVKRRQILKEIVGKNTPDDTASIPDPSTTYTLYDEIQWTKEQLCENQKNYQVWHHMLCLMKETKYSIMDDKEMLEMGIQEPKNIHYWSMLMSVVTTKEELYKAYAYTKECIAQDIRNNSAYSARYSIVKRILQMDSTEENGIMKKEVEYMKELAVLKHNSAYWNYVRGLDREYPSTQILSVCEEELNNRVISEV